ncbi:MAG: hypothetical protein P1U37_19360 [Minwuia sp.]|nr:hypothetical protein [Minwuia sp.]
MIDGLQVAFEPLVPSALLILLGIFAVVITLFGLFRQARGTPFRLLLLLILFGVLSGPILLEEERRYHDDVVLVVVDRSTSQSIADRTAQTETALAAVLAELDRQDALEVRVVEAGPDAGGPADGTHLASAIRRGLEGVPVERTAGVILISDGQVHDLPAFDVAEGPAPDLLPGPLHLLLTGVPAERDRRIEIVNAPTFAVVDQTAETSVIVHDQGAGAQGGIARVRIRRDGVELETRIVPVGREAVLAVPINHGGRNLIEFEVEADPAELTDENNRAAITVNGVRDRLRVLLVSGEPYPGERAWRNLLKADPAVDLVHFTILRPPQKQDATPIHELALIAFPIRELFEIKLYDFDLIIFDRFWRRGVLHFSYLENIARYVQEGGALLNAAGPSFAGPASIYRTPLRSILPGKPTGEVTTVGFRPTLTDTGRRHPVTAGLEPGPQQQPWGRWFRSVDVAVENAEILMHGPQQKPLLILDRVGEGRVAQVMSDHGWLWSRGLEGGGPQAEVMRRTAHWLMKEPALEEESLRADVDGATLKVTRRSLAEDQSPVTVTGPDGVEHRLDLTAGRDGIDFGRIELTVAGLYRIGDGTRSTIAVLGNLNPVEFSDLVSTDRLLRPFVDATNGGIIRLARHAEPEIRRVEPGRQTAGSTWLGLLRNGAFDVTGLKTTPLAPPLAVLLTLLILLLVCWRREGQ